MERVPFRIRGEEIGACNCAWGCPCQFNALPTHGRCEGFMVSQIAEGHFGDVRLDGVTFAAAFKWPKAIHEGDGTFQLIFDDRTTAEQREAIVAMTSGAHGGTIFEVFSAVAPHRPAPIIQRISVTSDRASRTAECSLPGLVEYRAAPIRNPVTGEEHRAIIRLPGGFEYEEAEVGNSVQLKVNAGPVQFEHHDSYAQFNAFDWSNAARE